MTARVAAFAALLLARAITRAEAPQDPSQASVPEIGKAAEEVAAQLRQMSQSLADAAVFSALESEVGVEARRSAERWTATGHLLENSPRLTALDSLASSWDALRAELEDVSRRIEARARRREADVRTLGTLRDFWTRALDLARTADAPASVLERGQATLAAIEAIRPAVEERRARVLVLQDAVSQSLQTSDDALARIGDARREAVARLFVAQRPPAWRMDLRSADVRAGRRRFVDDVAANVTILSIYGQAYGGRLALSGLLVLVLFVLLRRGRPAIERLAGHDASLEPAAAVFRKAAATAVLLGVVLARPLRPYPPIALQKLTLAVVTVAAVLTLRPLIAPRLMRGVYAFAILFVVNLVRELLELPPGLEQVTLMAEMAVTTALLIWVRAHLPVTGAFGFASSQRHAVARTVVGAIALGCGTAFLAAALGYVELADFLGVGLFYLAFVAFGLLAFRVAADGVIAIVLVRGPLARLRAIAHNRRLVERHLRTALDVGAVALWIVLALARFELLDAAGSALQAALDATVRVGELEIVVGRVLGFVAVVIAAYVTTRLVVFLLEEDVYSRMALPRGVPYALSSLTRYGLLLLGFLLALATLGLDLTRITVLLSAFGVGIGFGLQQIINNFVSGLILLFERPIQVGDSVQLGDLVGDVLRIGIRSSTVRTSQGAEVIVPNSRMLEEKVTNWTLSDRRRRIELDIGVGYDAESEQVIELLVEVARRDPRVSADPPPEALLVRFGEHSADFQLRVWTDEVHWMRLRSDLAIALQRALRSARPGMSPAEPPPGP